MPTSKRTLRPVDQRDIDILEALMGWSDPLPAAAKTPLAKAPAYALPKAA